MNQDSSEQASQLAKVQSTVLQWSQAAESYVAAHPREVIQTGQGIAFVVLLVLLVVARRARRLRETVRRQAAEIARLAMLVERHQEPQEETQRVAASGVEVQRTELVEEVDREVPTPPEPVEPPLKEVSEQTKVSQGLQKSRAGFLSRLTGFLSGRSKVDASALDDLEELLILSDVGARCAAELVQDVRAAAENGGSVAPAELAGLLQEGIFRTLVAAPRDHRIYQPNTAPLVVLVVGVNGVGKTTTVAKLATKYMGQGKRVLAIAADTFRAAAVEQLAEWSSRVGFTLVRGPEGAKPSAVVFDGMKAACEGGYDVVLIDTAGRLHTKSNLMQELEGVRNVIRKHVPEAPHETVLVLDGVSGQNALSQAREFNQAVPLTGIVVTKLDGTPKGGIIVAISQELKLPVFFIGVGEKVGDLVPFDRKVFVSALFDERGDRVPEPQVGNT
jgi:fused signal recognition particle receptor